LADTTAPVISEVSSSSVTSSGATITWTTDEPSTTQVEYGLTTSYGSSTTLNSTLVTSHSQAITGLSPSTTYYYKVKSKDASNNLGILGSRSFTTLADTTAPVISEVSSSSVTSSGATITWTTNEASTTQVEYGTTLSYGSSTTLNSTLVTSHSQAITGLSPSTTYYYKVKSKDASNNLRTSGGYTFTTLTNYTLTITKTGTGSGTVTSSPSGIDCGAACSASYSSGTQVTLTPTAASGSAFTGWSGACTGTGSCVVSMTADRSVTANFTATSCSLTANKTNFLWGETFTWNVTSVPNGTAYWYGTHNGVIDATDLYYGPTPLSGSLLFDSAFLGTYTRYLKIKDAGGNVMCTTNTLNITVSEPVYQNSFESGVSGWSTFANCAADSSWSISQTPYPAPGGGSYNMRLHMTGFASGCTGGIFTSSPQVAAIPGSTYYADNMSRSWSNAGDIWIEFQNSAGTYIRSCCNTWQPDAGVYKADSTFSCVAPSGAAYVRIRYSLTTANSNADVDLLNLYRR
jgi:hypothetical protein